MGNMEKKKILIVYATAGAGHKKAAIAIYNALQKTGVPCEPLLVDSLDYTNAFFRWAYPRIYIFMITKASLLWGFFYYTLDWKPLYPLVRIARRINNFFNSSAFVKMVEVFKPDVVISTHFLAGEIVGDLKKKGRCEASLITVVTDYRCHSFWVSYEAEKFTVAHERTRDDLIGWGVDSSRIEVIGIPIDPVFAEVLDKKNATSMLGIRSGRFTILIASGGFGVGPIEGLVKSLNGLRADIQLLIVCGHNKALCESLRKRHSGEEGIEVYGFIDNMHELMSAADIMITKSGGLTTSEALAKEIPMIIISPVPGQETRNCDVLVASKAAIKARSVDEVMGLVRGFIADKDKIEELRLNASAIRRPDATGRIIEMIR